MIKRRERQQKKNRILDSYIQQERFIIKEILGMPIVWGWIICLVMGDWIKILIWLGITIAMFWILWWICGSFFSIRYSKMGKELQKYGNLKTIKKDVEEQAKKALYCSGNQAITEKYLILSIPISDQIKPINREKLCLISTSEIAEVRITEKLYGVGVEDEGYTMHFFTFAGKAYQLTVWRSYKEVFQIKTRLEECRNMGVGPFQSSIRNVSEMGNRNMDRRRIREEQKRARKERILSGKTAVSIQECYKKKKKVCIWVYLVFLSVFFVIFGWGMWTEREDLKHFFLDIRRNIDVVSLVLGVYWIPMPVLYGYVYWLEKQVLCQYQRLKYFEQQEINQQIVESPELKAGDVIYGRKCFWFRDARRLLMHNLIFYEDVIWVYLSNGRVQTSMHGVDMPVFFLHSIIFYTKDGRKHSIFMGNGAEFSRHFPWAVKGYGKEQKKEYLRIKRGRK